MTYDEQLNIEESLHDSLRIRTEGCTADYHVLDIASQLRLHLLADESIHQRCIVAVIDPKVFVTAKVLEELLPEDTSTRSFKAICECLSNAIQNERYSRQDSGTKETKISLLTGNDGRS